MVCDIFFVFYYEIYKLVGIIAAIMSGVMAILYLIPGSGCTFTVEEAIIAVSWIVIGTIFAIVSKKKYGKRFGVEES